MNNMEETKDEKSANRVNTVNVLAKASDTQVWTFGDDDGKLIYSHEGYAPFIPGLSDGDYIDLTIDNATGKIIGWVPIDDQKFEEIIAETVR